MRDNFQLWITVEKAREYHTHHGHRSFIGPVEAPPHFKARFFLGRIVRHGRRADWMKPDWQVEFRHGGENRLKLWIIKRPPRNIGVEQHTARTEIFDRATRLRDRAFNVGHA